MMNEILEHDVEALHGASFAWALTCCGGRREEAEDVLQTVYAKVLEGRARFDGRSRLKTWLFAVIWRTAADGRRRRGWRKTLLSRWMGQETADRDPTPEERLARAERGDRVRQALETLTERQRQVLEAVFFHDLSIREAAEVLGLSLGTARVHYERGKKALAKHLETERCHVA